VKPLLDEHYSPQIAEQLRRRGHDVVAVAERDDLRGATDRQLWDRAAGEGRGLVTENAADVMPLVRTASAAAETFAGVVFTSSRSLPRSRQTIGTYVALLDRLLHERPADDALAGQVLWLSGG
jgi:NAD(P)-dependent dehydrogenase (short-subunit alcohol dehydrogenase family)